MLKRKHDKIINIMQLRFFCQVALRGSVSRAADDLFRTQSAITRAIRDLEAALNVTLFERHLQRHGAHRVWQVHPAARPAGD